MLRAIVTAALLAALAPGVAWGSSWRWPVRGRVVGSFLLSPDDPYAAGQRRGIVIASRPGTTVVSACTGRVAFAGSIGRAGPTLSIDCGALRATYQGLGATFVHRGAVVIADAPVARVGPGGALHLGARMDGARVRPAYRDPRSLLRDRPPVAGPLGRAPRDGGVRRRERRGPPGSAPEPSFAPGPEPAPRPAPARLPSAAPAPAPTPLAAWVGLALLAAAVPVGSVWHWRTARATRAAGTRPPRSLAAERR